MRSSTRRKHSFRLGVAVALLLAAAPASAQWTRVTQVPLTKLFSIRATGDTILAGADTTIHYSTDAGVTWHHTARPVAGSVAIEAALVRGGRLYAATYGQGVFVSDNFGATWASFNQELVGGFEDSQLNVVDLALRGDLLIAATAGASVYTRHLAFADTWHPSSSVFEDNQDPNLSSLVMGGGRVLAMGGSNGDVFFNDAGDADWTISRLDNLGIHAGLGPMTGVWTGGGWVVGTNSGMFRSANGDVPWTRSTLGLPPVDWTAFSTQGRHLFAAIDIAPGAVMEESDDDGATWQNEEFLPNAFVFKMAVSGANVYAARGDGLWRRPTGTVSVMPDTPASQLRFAVSGPQPFRDATRLSFALAESGRATIEVFDLQGRATGPRIDGMWSAGPHEVAMDARGLSPGVYEALLTAGGTRETVRLVHVK